MSVDRCILFAYSPWNLVTMNPMLQRLLTFPSQFKPLTLLLATDLNLLNSTHNCRYQWTLLRWWFDVIVCMWLPRHDWWQFSQRLALHERGSFVSSACHDNFLPDFRSILVLHGHCHSLPFYGLNLVTTAYTVKLLLKDIVTPQERLCKTAS